MKKYIVVVMLGLLFLGAIYAKCCDCKNNYITYLYGSTTTGCSHELKRMVNNAKKYTEIEKLVGKMVHRITPLGTDKSYIGSSRKLLDVTDKYLILTSEVSCNGLHELERATWDDGNWKEVVKNLWTVIEITVSSSFPLTLGLADKYCVRCGGRLQYILGNNNYYCGSCKTGFNVMEE